MTRLEIALAPEDERHGGGVTDPPPKKPKPRSGGKTTFHVAALALLERDPAINCRAGGVNEELAADYAENVEKLPPVVAFRDADGKLWLADGWHRCRAHELAGKSEIAVDVREGDRRAALLYAASANAIHGARRSNADKRRSVLALLADPEWQAKSDRWIAEQCAVNHELVGTLREGTGDSASSSKRGKDGKVRRSPKRAFRAPPAEYRAACRALTKISTAWAQRKPLDEHLAEARRALDELERRATE